MATQTTRYVGSEVRCWGRLNGATTETPGLAQTNTPTTIQIDPPGVGAQRVRLYQKVVVGPDGVSCAIDVGGRLQCWGSSLPRRDGPPIQVDDRSFDASGTFSFRSVTDVAIGDGHVCAIMADRRVACWGSSGAGAVAASIGAGVVRVAASGSQPDLTDVTQITAGRAHTCALKSDGTVWCWSEDRDAVQVVLPPNPGGGGPAPLGTAQQITAGGDHTCAGLRGGVFVCWGSNENGELGDLSARRQDRSGQGELVSLFIGIADFRQVVAGRRHTCVLVAGGGVRCWGANEQGQCGQTPSATPTDFRNDGIRIPDAVEISAGDDHTCVRLRSGEVRCWGGNESGQLGLRTNVSPVPTPPSEGALCCQAGTAACASGCINPQTDNAHCGACGNACPAGQQCAGGRCNSATSCGLCVIASCSTRLTACLADMSCKAWFDCHAACNDDACRSACMNRSSTLAAAVTTCQASSCARACEGHRLAAGGDHTCAILRSASNADGVVCWGANEAGQLGVVNAGRCEATQNGAGAVEVVGGSDFTCARTAVGAVQCWGRESEVTRAPLITGAVEIAAGSSHACARLSDGTVRCWGLGISGQLGYPDPTMPGPVVGLSDAVEISAGAFHTCARLSNGSVKCWGANEDRGAVTGQLGSVGPTTTMPRDVAGLTGAVEIAAGYDHTCARLASGAVQCWGSNDAGQLGREGMGGPMPMAVTGLMGAVEIAAGRRVTCAIVGNDRNVSCWGAAMGAGGTAGATPRQILVAPGMPLRDAVEIAVTGTSIGGAHACARRRDGNVWCWGLNDDGQLGIATTIESATAVQSVCSPGCEATARAMMPAATTTTTCALTCVDTATNSEHCGQCDNACPNGRTCVGGMCSGAPMSCASPDTACGAGAAAGCFDLQTSPQHCGTCGRACMAGELCIAGECTRATPTRLAAGFEHTCVIADGTVRCWGRDARGQRGDGPQVSSEVCSGPNLRDVVEIAAGASHTCARLQSGEVRCWGANNNGQLGDGTRSATGDPHPVRASATDMNYLTGVVEIAAGASHTCARLQSGEVRCWGNGDNGRLGNGTSTRSTTPVAVMGLTNAVEIEAGEEHTCARLQSGEVRCWGRGVTGQLGNGTSTESTTPVAVRASAMGVDNLTGVVEIAAGGNHTCARLQSGDVRCWGFNGYGQLGNGTETGTTTPVAVMGLTNAVEIAAGEGHTCARLQSGEVRCWGRGFNGLLGNGTSTNSATPVAVRASAMGVDNLTGVVEIAAGKEHTCARLQSGEVRCWGSNLGGQLGNAPRAATGYLPAQSSTPLLATCTRAPMCMTGQTACGGACCAMGEACVAGACVATSCPMGQTACPSAGCVNLMTDRNHCGACSQRCMSSQSCTAGRCVAVVTSGCMVDGDCATGERCVSGVCTATMTMACMAPRTMCGMACVDTQTDRNQCGACGVVCVRDSGCYLGTCQRELDCNGNGFIDVRPDGDTEYIDTSITNCGGCSRRCVRAVGGGAPTCTMGVCSSPCPFGQTSCSGTCVNTGNDPNNCGGCGTRCSPTQVCSMGTCTLSCTAGFTNCSGTCVDLTNNASSCGACGTSVLDARQRERELRVARLHLHLRHRLRRLQHDGVRRLRGPAHHDHALRSLRRDVPCHRERHRRVLVGDVRHRLVQHRLRGLQRDGGRRLRDEHADVGLQLRWLWHRVPRPQRDLGMRRGRLHRRELRRGLRQLRRRCSANGCEANLNTSLAHCGACGAACVAGANARATCATGTCRRTCDAGFADCNGNPADGCEANLAAPTSCGSCTTMCSGATPLCTSSSGTSSCSSGCAASETRCGSSCVNTATSVDNCGACGTMCPERANAARSCAMSTCGFTCSAGFADCDMMAANGCEAPLDTVLNCGACGMACAAPVGGMVACVSGACNRTCPAGTHLVGAGGAFGCVDDNGPKPLAPQSLGDVTQLQPAFRWSHRAGTGADGAIVEVCADRACTTVVQTIRGAGTASAPVVTTTATAALTAARVYYWRARAMVGSTADTGSNSPVWMFRTPRANRGAVQTSVRPHLDVNGDGFDDMAVAAPAAGGGAGRVDVYLGSASGLSTTAHRSFTGAAGSALGTTLSPAGDVNGDGYGDLLVGAPGAASGNGGWSLYLGSASGLPTSATLTVTGTVAAASLGFTVAGVGDVDRDGYADLVAGAPGATSGAGAATWYRGQATITAATTLTSAALAGSGGAASQFALTLTGAGDINGDGFADVVVGEPGFGSNLGRLHAFFGAASGLPGTTTARVNGGTVGDRFTEGLAGVGDFNADGFSDFVTSAPFALGGNVGGFNLWAGSASGVGATVSVPAGNVSNGGWSRVIAGAGDVDGDNRDDLLIAMPFVSSNAGRVFLVSGPAAVAAGFFGFPMALFTQSGSAAGASLGASLAGLGDTNGDGFADVAFGAPGESADARGVVFVLRGATTVPSTASAFVTASALGDRLGASLASPDAIVAPAPPTCPTGQTRCSGACVDTRINASNCGACGVACTAGQTCSAGTCTGSTGCTPGAECRAAAGPCDVAEVCTAGGTCPADAFAASTTVCRAAAGVCDAAETCTGSSAACPTDAFLPSTTECRAAVTSACNPAERCTGMSTACPSDVASSCTTGQTCVSGVCMTSGCGTGTTACGSECCTSSQVCGGTRCRTLATMSSVPTTLRGDTMTGMMFALACPTGQVLTGFTGMTSGTNGFERIAGTCVAPRLVAGATPSVSVTGSTTATMDSGRGGFGGSFPFELGCAPGTAVVGFQIDTETRPGVISALNLRCAPVTVTASGAGFAVSRGTVVSGPGTGTDPFSGGTPTYGPETDCPATNGFASGFTGTLDDPGFGGTSHKSFGLTCTGLSITP